MGNKPSKGDNPNIILRRQWKELFFRIANRADYDGIGRLIIAIYEELDGDQITPELSDYLWAIFDNLITDIKNEHKCYKATCDANRENIKARWEAKKVREKTFGSDTTVYDRIQSNTENTKTTYTSSSSSSSTNQVQAQEQVQTQPNAREDIILSIFGGCEDE